MSRRPWLPLVRHLLGILPDTEIARRAGVHPYTVGSTRRKLGIPPSRSRDLASFTPAEVLRLVRARAKSGWSMRAPDGEPRLTGLCRYHFGGWYAAVEAAGLKPAGAARIAHRAPPKPRPLTEAMLRGSKSAAELERLTGVPRTTIRYRRRQLGIDRDERMRADLSWVPSVSGLLGKLPDTEVARRAGVTQDAVFLARRRLGIARCPKPSKATTVRDRLEWVPKLRTWPPPDQAIMRERILADRPATLAEIGRRFGISRQRVAQRERVVVALARAT